MENKDCDINNLHCYTKEFLAEIVNELYFNSLKELYDRIDELEIQIDVFEQQAGMK